MAAARRTAAVLVSALLASCSFEAAFDGPGYRYDPDHARHAGTVCVGDPGQLAGTSGNDGGGNGDGDGGDLDALLPGTIIERACPGTIIDQDAFDFESETRWYWFVNGNGEIAAMDGVAHAELHESNARAGLVSTGNYPLPDTAFAFRLPAPAPQDETYAAFEIITEDEATALLTVYRSS